MCSGPPNTIQWESYLDSLERITALKYVPTNGKLIYEYRAIISSAHPYRGYRESKTEDYRFVELAISTMVTNSFFCQVSQNIDSFSKQVSFHSQSIIRSRTDIFSGNMLSRDWRVFDVGGARNLVSQTHHHCLWTFIDLISARYADVLKDCETYLMTVPSGLGSLF